MNKLIKTGLTTTLAICAAFAAAQSGPPDGIMVTVDGTPVDFQGQQPMSYNGRVLVPLRGVFEQMGAFVNWNPATREVYAMRGHDDVHLAVGSRIATVDGRRLALDAPPRIVNGSTMVPLRFLGESLGADVRWDNPSRLVAISTQDDLNGGRAETIVQEDRTTVRDDRDDREERRSDRIEIPADTVLPVRLSETLSSTDAHRGDHFRARVETRDTDYYNAIPEGTYVEGHVAEVHRQHGDRPGVLDLAFDRLVLPDGTRIPIDGSLYGLDDRSVRRTDGGRIVARNVDRDNRATYVGYGAGAGLVLGAIGHRPLTGALLGGLLGLAVGSAERSNQRPADVTLDRGTEFGIRLNDTLVVER